MKKRTSYTHEFYVLNRDLKSLICSDNRLGNIYKTIDILDKSCKYNIFFKITDDGYIREIKPITRTFARILFSTFTRNRLGDSINPVLGPIYPLKIKTIKDIHEIPSEIYLE